MFATLLGPLPRPPIEDARSLEAGIEVAVRAQEAAGLEPLTDGGYRDGRDPVAGWHATAGLTDRAVKQPLEGPYTTGRALGGTAAQRTRRTIQRATALNRVLLDLASAGCPLVEIHEPAAVLVGTDPAERALFADAHLRLLDGVSGTHLSLAITGGNADTAGIETILAARYQSLAVDLVGGPDNWRLVMTAPGDRGIVCGALPVELDSYDGPEPLLWAAGYAASGDGRGRDRVGLATAASLAHLSWGAALHKIQRLGEAVRVVDLPADERILALDPRAVDSRSAALGRVGPRPSHRPGPPTDPT
jgi:methionine synthase II (cobalamin-independent)